ncbi:MAG: aspartate carbamoyltransferase catalytic subunit [Bacteroidetes bacterium]|jgi:aspartate carbamoyltransferase catalytic subunit|nr:aspartate carbamoyltransferase catalytic subunit [Bacteroidota bacterium]MCL5033789.1 aspartate carbamoyltransferase catalytic subunit [Bacteroidota bacterium]
MAQGIRNLLGLRELTPDEILEILDTARSFREVLERPIKKVPTLQGTTVVNLFFESSTRTRISFELAERRLSADVVNFAASGSSVSKGETLKDTARNIEAMKTDVTVIRHPSTGAPHFLSRLLKSPVINAGDGINEHPTQGLLDMFTIREKFGGLKGLNVCIVGDITHSRVARSNIFGLTKSGANVAVCGPRTLIPDYLPQLGVKVFYDIDAAIQWADILNVLRIQMEREAGGDFPSIREYRLYWGINRTRLERSKKPVVIMHPGPINRGVELDADIADGETSLILDQVTNGVAVRMAVLFLTGVKPS